MKKKQKTILRNLGKMISSEEFQKDDSAHEFSQSYHQKKNLLLENLIASDNSKRIKSHKFMLAIGCLVILCLPVSAFAASKVINGLKINKVQTDPYAYQYNFQMETEQESEASTQSSLYHSNVKFSFGYLPEGYVNGYQNSNKFSLNGNHSLPNGFSVFLQGVDDKHGISIINAIESNDFTIGNNKATLVHKNYVTLDTFDKELLVFYNEYGYVLQIFGQTQISDEELIKVAENIQLVSCSKEEALYISYEKTAEEKASIYASPSKSSDTNKTTIDTTTPFDKSKFLSLGTPFNGLSTAYTPTNYTPNNFTFTVENFEIKDSIAGFDTSRFPNFNAIKNLINDSGVFNPYVKVDIAKGDGKTTLDTAINKTTTNLKFVYVTLKLKNNSDQLLKDTDIIPTLCCLNNTNGNLTAPESIYTTPAINSFGGAVYCDHPSMYDENPSDTSAPYTRLQQVYSIKPNEEFEYHIGYIVEENNMDNMVLYFNANQNNIAPNAKAQTIIQLSK